MKITKAVREEAIELCLIASNNRALDPYGDGVTCVGAALGADPLAIDLAFEALPYLSKTRWYDDAEWYAAAAERLERGWRPRAGWRRS
jgi:hypothetical protein